MHLTITTEGDDIHNVEVDNGASVAGLKTVVEFHSGIAAADQQLWYQGTQLQDSASLTGIGVQDHDLIELRRASGGARPGGQSTRAEENMILEQLRRNPAVLAQLPSNLREGVQRNDPSILPALVEFLQRHQAASRQAQIDALNQDEFDPEAQARIEEHIRQSNIDANVDAAMEHSPEVFAEVTMLYVELHVNNVPLNAFVDSGAQRCVMSLACAQRCNIAHLIDKRFRSISRGVGGEQMDVGRVHSVSVKVGNQHIPMAVTVLEKLDIDFLFGLDMLRRHRCVIDLSANCLRFGSLEDTRLQFLAEHQIPKRQVLSAEEAAAVGNAAGISPIQAAGAAAASRASGGSAAAPAPSKSSQHQIVPQPPATAGLSPGQQAGTGQEEYAAELEQLMTLGFPKQQCLEALKACNGNADHAAALLFGG